MMRFLFFYLLAGLCLAPSLWAADLRVEVTGQDEHGDIYLHVYASAQAMQQQRGDVASVILPVSGGVQHLTLHGLPAGSYAVAAFQDRNGNGRLDNNLFGMPSEPYGLSRDQRRAVFADTAITLGTETQTVTIHLR